MSTIIILIISAGALVIGIICGYYLRKITALGQRRSIEIDIKQMQVAAKEEAQKITDEAKKKAEQLESEMRETVRNKTDDFKNTEDRLI